MEEQKRMDLRLVDYAEPRRRRRKRRLTIAAGIFLIVLTILVILAHRILPIYSILGFASAAKPGKTLARI